MGNTAGVSPGSVPEDVVPLIQAGEEHAAEVDRPDAVVVGPPAQRSSTRAGVLCASMRVMLNSYFVGTFESRYSGDAR